MNVLEFVIYYEIVTLYWRIFLRYINGLYSLFQKEHNQKFGLLQALLRIGEWKIFRKICNKLPITYVVSQYPIAYNLCQLIHLLIEPIYRRWAKILYFVTSETISARSMCLVYDLYTRYPFSCRIGLNISPLVF